MILLVDFAHAWAEKCLEKIEMEELTGEGDASFGKIINWRYFGNVYWKYYFNDSNVLVFTGNGCSMNKTAISLNLVFNYYFSNVNS